MWVHLKVNDKDAPTTLCDNKNPKASCKLTEFIAGLKETIKVKDMVLDCEHVHVG